MLIIITGKPLTSMTSGQGDGRGADAEDAVAVAPGAGEGQNAVLDKHLRVVGAVHRQHAPAIGGQLAAVVVNLCVIGQLAQAVGAPDADTPAPAAQFRIRGIVAHAAVVGGDHALATGVDRCSR